MNVSVIPISRLSFPRGYDPECIVTGRAARYACVVVDDDCDYVNDDADSAFSLGGGGGRHPPRWGSGGPGRRTRTFVSLFAILLFEGGGGEGG